MTESTKTTDAKGRVALGKAFANKTVIVRAIDETEMRVSIARVLPEREAWLLENPKARKLVETGLREAESHEFSEAPPNLDADAALADELEDR
ncbi:MAG: hypothetical protein ACE5E5_15890 [Phycisphaerae bacterium]